ncbi:hypothetical protein BLX87_23220 [Bacillus sp. VT-16-64]|nr:hypothetical protein BLX87_23220 [Bacillus sp. VT-16-64]
MIRDHLFLALSLIVSVVLFSILLGTIIKHRSIGVKGLLLIFSLITPIMAFYTTIKVLGELLKQMRNDEEFRSIPLRKKITLPYKIIQVFFEVFTLSIGFAGETLAHFSRKGTITTKNPLNLIVTRVLDLLRDTKPNGKTRFV